MYSSWKQFKPVWLAALRSGEYRQGDEYLCRMGKAADKFCCLGVAYDLLVQAGQGEWTVDPDYTKVLSAGGVLGSDAQLLTRVAIPPWFKRVLQKPAFDTEYLETDVEEHLATRNDRGERFASIADWIEENL